MESSGGDFGNGVGNEAGHFSHNTSHFKNKTYRSEVCAQLCDFIRFLRATQNRLGAAEMSVCHALHFLFQGFNGAIFSS